MILYYCDHHEIPLPPGHKFPVAKYGIVRELLARTRAFQFEPSPMADAARIELIHEPSYVRGFLEGTLAPSVMRRIGFPWSDGLVKRTLASVGGTLAATQQALETGWGGNLAGGTHHAFRGEGAGFCVFNDIAIAIESVRAVNPLNRAAVIDLDVHQGDGTASIFENDAAVLTFSMHGKNNFPFRKQRSKIDVELEDGACDEEYLERLYAQLPRVFEFAPAIVYYQSGVDALAADALGRLSLTHQGLLARDRLVMESCKRYGAPLVVTLGGGYAKPVELTAEAHANTFRVAAGVFGTLR